uniref:Uncharacterized protein n=1 Tax=viral metagenome TaxID=1070528 RepID=A0A6C0KUI8_9ZZZZ
MNYTLNDNDYTKILEYYKLDIPKSSHLLKKKAENVISQKLCSCIKKVGVVNEPKAIGVCTKSVINRKGFKRGNFTCKGKRKIILTKIKKNNNSSTRKNKH